MSAFSSTAASASSSTAANSNISYGWDVFLNHHGPDVKSTFVIHLYRRLISDGLKVFLDREGLEEGYSILSKIQQAITNASVHVAIFSPGYADSKWCLDELVEMLESKAPIIPVFYSVRPSDLRWTHREGKYARALQRLEVKRASDGTSRYDSTIVEKWRNALSVVADISGFDLEDCSGDEVELVDKVVQAVLRSVKKTLDPIGLDEKVRDFENTVFCQNHQSAKPQVVGIVGVGGVGKTTLAKELFNRRSLHQKKCFLFNVRDNAGKGQLTYLQSQLLKSLTGSDVPINNINDGREKLKTHLSSSTVLVILDDVDDLNQIDALLPIGTDLLPDSLVVLTSRDKEVIRNSGVQNTSIYQLTGLTEQHSLELFCAYAFSRPFPLPEFKDLVKEFLEVCDGLPLYLEVFGALLSEKYDRSSWQELLNRLQVLPGETQKLLISYDDLHPEEQQMFLDTACFFIGQKRDTAITIWEGSGWKGRLGFQTLQNRCLLKVDSENNIEMHDHLRDFGRSVAGSLSPRRLWHCTHISDLLEQLSSTDDVVRGIRMGIGEYNDDVGAFDMRTLRLKGKKMRTLRLHGKKMRTLRLVDTENDILERILSRSIHFKKLIWLRWNKCPNSSLPLWLRMDRLRVLQVSGSALTTLWEQESQAPFRLRELEINAPLSDIPKSIGWLERLERIVVGKFSSGQVNLTKLPDEFCHLQSLKTLVLTDCSKMKSLPQFFGDLRRLQHINLSFCRNLERLPDSFGDLMQLQYINLSDCHDLVRLPDSIGNLWRLQYIDLRGCHNLERLPDSFCDLRDLRHINLSCCHDLQRLPDYFLQLIYLQHIDLQGCHNLEELPIYFGNLKNLQHINLSNCRHLERLADSIGELWNLEYMDLSGCHNLERFPNYIGNLHKLEYLDVEDCSNLIIERNDLIGILDKLPGPHQRHLEQLYE